MKSSIKGVSGFEDKREDFSGHQEINKLEFFKKSFLSACEEVEKFNRLCKLTNSRSYSVISRNYTACCTIVTALPPTQVSVERLFSALRFIKSDCRASMKENIIEAIFSENKL